MLEWMGKTRLIKRCFLWHHCLSTNTWFIRCKAQPSALCFKKKCPHSSSSSIVFSRSSALINVSITLEKSHAEYILRKFGLSARGWSQMPLHSTAVYHTCKLCSVPHWQPLWKRRMSQIWNISIWKLIVVDIFREKHAVNSIFEQKLWTLQTE